MRGEQGFPAVMPLLLEASGMEQASWLQRSEFPAAQFPPTFPSRRSYCQGDLMPRVGIHQVAGCHIGR